MKKWKDIERQLYKTAMSTGKKKKDNKNVLKMSLNGIKRIIKILNVINL